MYNNDISALRKLIRFLRGERPKMKRCKLHKTTGEKLSSLRKEGREEGRG
jgi:hypothetical protein